MTWIRFVLMLYFFMVAHKAACQTLSKAFLKSTKTCQRSCWCWRYFSQTIRKLKICSVVLLPVLKPGCSADTMHLIQRSCYQRRSPCQDPAGNRTTRRPPDDRTETQTAVVWPCLPFIRSGQNHLARHCERWKKTRQTEEEV